MSIPIPKCPFFIHFSIDFCLFECFLSLSISLSVSVLLRKVIEILLNWSIYINEIINKKIQRKLCRAVCYDEMNIKEWNLQCAHINENKTMQTNTIEILFNERMRKTNWKLHMGIDTWAHFMIWKQEIVFCTLYTLHIHKHMLNALECDAHTLSLLHAHIHTKRSEKKPDIQPAAGS